MTALAITVWVSVALWWPMGPVDLLSLPGVVLAPVVIVLLGTVAWLGWRLRVVQRRARAAASGPTRVGSACTTVFCEHFKRAPIPIYVWRRVGDDFELAHYNDGGLAESQGDAANYLGRRARDMLADHPEVRTALERCYAQRESIHDEIRFTIRPSGEVRRYSAHYVFSPPDFVMVYTEDITQQRNAERMLRMQRDLNAALGSISTIDEAMRAILEGACQAEDVECGGIYLVEEDTGDLVLLAHHNLSPEFVRDVTRFGPESRQGRLVRGGRAVYWDPETVRSMNPGVHAEGVRALAILPILDQDRAIGVLNLGTRTRPAIAESTRAALETTAARLGGVIARIRAQSALRESERNFRALAETTPTGIVISREGIYRYVNPAMAAMLGYAADELVGAEITTIVHPEMRAVIRARAAAREAGQPEPSRYEARALHRNGEDRWLDVSATHIEFEGCPAVLGSAVDITDRKRAEAAAQRQQELLAHVGRVATMGEMASGLAHELAQPLSAIQYFARGCAAQIERGTWEAAEVLPTLEKIATQADRAAEFIRRLKAFVRQTQPNRAPDQINDIVREALTLLLPAAREGGVQIRTELAEGLPEVTVDRIQVEQVILNLVRNAIEALRQVDLPQRQLVVHSRAGADGFVQVSVQDTGPGLAAEAAARVFEPFFTTKSTGLGLGLSISRTIIEAHEGELRAAPAPGGGALFSFTLPTTGRTKDDRE